ncbi:hypothetical protein SETIT_9G070800v2 [Setaria italica]|uniref:HMA domain-containing protein n=1 Tax=Setaria italica TaxID=4555 RepID=K4AM67_SETIT|nr:heavy metal-associated isoprenylated plant protein 33-like [Setaria italica]RCV40631.1 hypothetical protein SETIT_9G070800v2 [Setaria italica]
MIKEDILKVQTCVLKVNMHCPGCEKQVKKIIHKIDGVFQSSVDKDQGKVTVSGLMDPYTVIKKLNKAHKRAQLWGPNPGVASEVQKLQLGNGGKGQPKGGEAAASGSGGGGDGAKDEEMVMPPPPPPQQHPQQLQTEMEMKGVKLPPQLMGMGGKMPMPAAAPPAKAKDLKAVKFDVPEGEEPADDDSDSDDEFDDDNDFEDDGLDDKMMMMQPMAMPPAAGGGDKKGGNGGRDNKIPVQIKGNANIGDKIAELIRAKQNQGGAGGSGKNGGGAQAPQNGKGSAPGGRNQLPVQAKKGVAAGGPPAGVVGGPMMGGMPPPPPPQPGMMMRPPNMMGGAGFPGMGQTGGRPMGGMPMGHPQNGGVGMQPAGGGSATVHGMTAGGTMPGAGLYPGGAGVSVGGGMAPAPEMMQAAWNNPVAQQQPHMMMNGDGNHVHGGAGYPPMGYGYGYGYGRPPMYHPPPHPNDNMFSDENPNSCSVM